MYEYTGCALLKVTEPKGQVKSAQSLLHWPSRGSQHHVASSQRGAFMIHTQALDRLVQPYLESKTGMSCQFLTPVQSLEVLLPKMKTHHFPFLLWTCDLR